MTQPNSPDIVKHIAQHLSEMDLSEDQIGAVLGAWNSLREGDPVGTVRRDDDTGAIAHRVNADGVHLWRISAPDGAQHNDMQPALPWPAIHEP